MKSVAILVVLVACLACGEAGWWREKVTPVLKTAATAGLNAIISSVGRRELDVNKDGQVDQSELETIMSAREARAVLTLAQADSLSHAELEELVSLSR